MVDNVYMPSAGIREQLVEQGVALLEERGLGGFTGREVARRAGLSHGAPRRYFPTLAALLAAVAATGFDDLHRELAAVPGTPSLARVVALADHYVDFARRRPAMFELMFRHDLLEGSGERLREHSTPVLSLVLEAVTALGVAEPLSATVDLWAGVHGVAGLASRRAIEVMTIDPPGRLVRRQVRAHLGSEK
jgi:AcrR family transcriptional regulator